MDSIQFSHRPETGVSIGAFNDGQHVYVSAAIVNNGQSNSGLFHAERTDCFSRKMARNIINGRIRSMIAGETIKFGIKFPALGIDMRTFMSEFRSSFKPDLEETDDTFRQQVDFGMDLSVESRMTANAMWEKIIGMAENAMQTAHASTNI